MTWIMAGTMARIIVWHIRNAMFNLVYHILCFGSIIPTKYGTRKNHNKQSKNLSENAAASSVAVDAKTTSGCIIEAKEAAIVRYYRIIHIIVAQSFIWTATTLAVSAAQTAWSPSSSVIVKGPVRTWVVHKSNVSYNWEGRFVSGIIITAIRNLIFGPVVSFRIWFRIRSIWPAPAWWSSSSTPTSELTVDEWWLEVVVCV